MHPSLPSPRRSFRYIQLVFLGALTLLLSGWTCTAMFVSCQGVTQPDATSLSPSSIPSDSESVVLTVVGTGFTPQSNIMWNGNALPTAVLDSGHLQTTITQQTLESFGGSAGSGVQISVRSVGHLVETGCPVEGNSASLTLVIT